MAHRIYIYNTDKKDQEYFHAYLGEWNYVIPDLLLPLFAANPKAKGTLVYAEKESGVLKLRKFYDLLIQEYNLISNAPVLLTIEKMFDFLHGLPFECFQINARDVFNMSEVKHSQQAKDFAFEIHEKNLYYEKAIEKQSLSALYPILSRSGYNSFLAMLEAEWSNYGLGWWNTEAIDSLDNQFFEEKGCWGIRNAKGEVKVEPRYEEIGDFDYNGFAVVEKEGLFGYLNRKGEEAIPCIYDAAAPVQSVRGRIVGKVSLAGKHGLVDVETGATIIPLNYEVLDDFAYGFYQSQRDGKYDIIDAEGKGLHTTGSDEPFEIDYEGFIYQPIANSKLRKYYSNQGVLLGEYPEGVLNELLFDFYAVNLNNKKKKSVHAADGSLLVKDVVVLNALNGLSALYYLSEGKYFLYDLASKGFLLQDLTIKSIQGSADFGNGAYNCYIIETESERGIYHTETRSWLIPLSAHYATISYALMDYFILQDQVGGYYYYDTDSKELSESFDFICGSVRHYQDLMMLRDGKLFNKGYEGLEEVPQDQYGYYIKALDKLEGKELEVFDHFFIQWKSDRGVNFESAYDSYTLYHMAMDCCRNGDVENAIRYFTFSADQDNESSMYELGNIYTDTDNEDTRFLDLKKGIVYYERSAKKGYASSWNSIGYLYQHGIGYTSDLKKAFEAYNKGADLGNGYALSNLGYFYFSGTYVEEDLEKALDYYKKAELKLVENNRNIASIYYSLNDYDRLLVYLKRDKADGYSNIYYGLMYDAGLKFKKDSKKAIHYFERANRYSVYESATESLLGYYKNDPNFMDQEKHAYWSNFARQHKLDIEPELLIWADEKSGAVEAKDEPTGNSSSSFFSKLFKKKK